MLYRPYLPVSTQVKRIAPAARSLVLPPKRTKKQQAVGTSDAAGQTEPEDASAVAEAKDHECCKCVPALEKRMEVLETENEHGPTYFHSQSASSPCKNTISTKKQ